MTRALRGVPAEHKDPTHLPPMWRLGAVVSRALFDLADGNGFDFTTHLKSFAHKVLFLRSDLDTAHTLESQQQMAAHYADADIITMAGAGHEMIYEAPAAYLAYTRDRGTKNDLGRMTSLGANAGVVGGYYAPHWFAAEELGFDYALTTHIANAQLYRDTVYENARDGWYVNPGGNYRLGGQAGASFGRYELALRAGFLRDMKGGQPMFPLHATLACATSW